MTRRLIIIGAGGFGREVLWYASDALANGRDWTVAGFLDRDPAALAAFDLNQSVVGDPLSFQPREDDVFICAIADPIAKLKICRNLVQRGARFASLIHRTALLCPTARIGRGGVLCPYTTISTNVVIGDFVTINCHSGIGHDATLADGCTLSAFCDVTGRAKLGEGVFMGTHSNVLPGVHVGDYATIGAGTVAARKVRPWTTVMGVPARTISVRPADRPPTVETDTLVLTYS